MATSLKFFALTTLPTTLVGNAFYYIKNGNYAESYLTDSAGSAKMIGNSAMIQAIVAAELANWSGDSTSIVIVPTIAARDALAAGATTNLLVLVLDATGDSTVTSGAALYAYELTGTTWHKLSEFESMDVVLKWADLQDKPVSSVADIDDAVDKKHEHLNKAALDKIGEDAEGHLTYGGAAVGGGGTDWSEVDW